MRRAIALLMAAVAVALLGGPVPTASATHTSAAAEHRRIVEYWTPERQARAIPRDVVLRGGPREARKPGGGGGGTSTTTTGSTWNKGGPVTITTGKVFFRENGTRYTCSASAVASDNDNLVLTAGHCVHGGDGGGFVTDWEFIPGWTGPYDARPIGTWTATDLFTTSAWSESGDFVDDAGFAVVYGGSSTSLESALANAPDSTTGTQPPTVDFTSTPVDGNGYTSFGYPAAKKYNGNVLTYCAGVVNVEWDGPGTMALPCNMTGGSSGGPWYKSPFSNGSPPGVINSLNSYGYASLNGYMFGPIFDSGEKSVYDAARVAGATCAPSSSYACTNLTVTV